MTEPTLKIGPSGYKLNPEKLKGAPQSVLPYILGCFYFTEEYEYFDVSKIILIFLNLVKLWKKSHKNLMRSLRNS